METSLAKEGRNRKVKSEDFDYTNLAIQAGVVILQGALWGLSSSLASQFVSGYGAQPELALADRSDVVTPLRAKAN